jgi:flavin-dependent dehydrogenase
MIDRYDMAVIGGGPAGAAAAITAARRGKHVVLVERGRYPRHKVCGEFVSAESLQLLGDLLEGAPDLLTTAPRINKTRVFLSAGDFEAPIEPAAASIARYELDHALWNAARASGVDTRDGCGMVMVSRENGGFAVDGGQQIKCQRVILANGRRTDQGAAPSALVGIKAHFRPDKPLESVDLYFGESGYCGVQPLGNGSVNVCALVHADALKHSGGERMRAAFEVHARMKQVKWEQVTEMVATAALKFAEPEPLRDGMACAGDAAGFIDPFLGDGISLALQSGALAGSLESPEEYAAEYARRFLPVFRRAARLRKLLHTPAIWHRPALLLMKWPGVARAVVERTRASARNACLLRD